jgi:hypothetical protein
MKWSIAVTFLCFSGLAVADDDVCDKDNAGKPVGIDRSVEGLSYGQWGGAWWAWIFSIPYSQNPVSLDATVAANADCNLFQDPGSKVFFLAGNSVGGGTNMQRTCIVPADKYLFFPLINLETDNGATASTVAQTNDQLKASLKTFLQAVDTTSLIATLDGNAISDQLSKFKVDPTRFSYVVPENDNLYEGLGVNFWGKVNPAFNAGYFLMLHPLKPGNHTLSLGGANTACQSGLSTPGCFSLEVTYNLTVLESAAEHAKEKKEDNDQDETAPVVPAAIAAPATTSVLFSVFASGTQNYTCSSGVWSAATPEATLYVGADATTPVFGSHFGGPEWFANDSSYVLGDKPNIIKAVQDPTAIPWLLVPVASTSATGLLANVTYVQRVNTVGGKETGTCDSTNDGAVDKVPYTANYYFFTNN